MANLLTLNEAPGAPAFDHFRVFELANSCVEILTPLVDDPLVEWNREALLPLKRKAREQLRRELFREPLQLQIPYLVARFNLAERELDERVIEPRGTSFQRHPHSRSVDLGQDIVRQI